ncbi:MAG: MBL fold metallo-hydrolase [Acidobacteria bacterium]|nr:MBL fold metallo-hydrolase [Acidobacteriota bacterium]
MRHAGAWWLGLTLVLLPSCAPRPAAPPPGPFVLVLGVAQDGGWPQAGCRRECCTRAWEGESPGSNVTALALVDPRTSRRWLFDATPDFPAQLRLLDEVAPTASRPGIDGIFLTHAHVGHYTGLAHLGREVMGTRAVPVHAMPRMRALLESNAPWEQLVRLGNIALAPLEDGRAVALAPDLEVVPFSVPHRDEYSETVGFRIRGPSRTVLFLPDIDAWDRWATPLPDALGWADVALLDGTFYSGAELPGRDLSDIPHPFIADTLRRIAALPAGWRARVRFIHLNHTNPALRPGTPERASIESAGCAVARQGEMYPLQ